MAIEVTVPRLGWSMDEGTFAEWLKREGEWVGKGDMLFVLEGDKAVQEVESFDEGFLRLIPESPSPGDVVRVGQMIAILLAKDEVASADADIVKDPPRGKDVEMKTSSSEESWRSADVMRTDAALSTEVALGHRMGPAARRLVRELKVDLTNVTGSGPSGRILPEDIRGASSRSLIASPKDKPHASPRARRRAHELGVDWTAIKGTGKSGRIRERDVVSVARTPSTSSTPHRDLASGEPNKTGRTKSTPIRRTIAQRMVASHLATAPVTLTTTVDATNLTGLRQQFKLSAASVGEVVPSYTDFIVKLLAFALKEHPMLNARWEDDVIVTYAESHIGIAVDTDAGLLVPVVRGVESLPLRTLAAQSKGLVDKARQQRLTSEEMQGGTFTVSNLGAFGIDAFTPIINGAQCAILGLGRIRRLPTYVEDQLVPRDMMTLSLTFDHRIVDGGPAARFLQTLSRAIENPAARLIE